MSRYVLIAYTLSLGLTLLCAPAAAQNTGGDANTAEEDATKVPLLGPGAGDKPAIEAEPGLASTADEWRLYKAVKDRRQYAAARESAEELLDRDDDSFVARYILGLAHHYGEGNLPRAAYYLEAALETIEEQHGNPPGNAHAKWHAMMLRDLGRTYTQLGRFEDAIEKFRDHDRMHPGELPEKISTVWPLMQLRRFDEALRVAHSILRDPSTEPGDRAVALNGYVAVLFERGDRREAHKWAKQLTVEFPHSPTFWANASESARGLMKLREAEKLALESTRRGVADYAQPWIDIADMRIRRGDHDGAFAALRSDRSYRRKRPAYLEQQGAASASRTVAMLMLVNNDPEGAMKVTRRTVVQPDRSGGKSRDIRQDVATSALLDWRARTDRAAQLEEHADILGGLRLGLRAKALQLRAESWASANRSQSVLHDNELLIGMIRVGGPKGVVLPPWLVPELANIVGPGIFYNAARRAEEVEKEEILGSYFAAFGADAELALGDEDDAADLARAALETLPEDEAMLRLRMEAIIAGAEIEEGDIKAALPRLERIMSTDPTLLRRLDIPLPVRRPNDGESAKLYDLLLGSDRYLESSEGFMPIVFEGQYCVVTPNGSKTKCVSPGEPDKDQSAEDFYFEGVLSFHDRLFRPTDRLPVNALRALDGSNATPAAGNRGLRDLAKPKPDSE